MKHASRFSWAVAAIAITITAMGFLSEPRLFTQSQPRGTQCSTAASATARSGQAATASREPLNPAAGAANGPMTAAQGAAILRELHAILLLLENGAASRTGARRPLTPQPVRMRIEPGWHGLGRTGAPVTMVEFADLQCPFCRRFETTIFTEIKRDYIDTGKMRFIARDFPLPMHPYAMGAAEAARCAGDQGAFWQFRDAVLDDQAPPTPDVLLKHAEALRLNVQAFQRCLSAGKFKRQIQADQAEAVALGIHGTPTFVIGRASGGWLNGLAIAGALPFPFFQQEIAQVLSGSRPGPGEIRPAARTRSIQASGFAGSQ